MNSKVKVAKYHSSGTKKTFDLLISLLGLIVLVPITIVFTPLYFFYSPGPIFFFQKRKGKNGKIFNIIKFRTMVINAEKLKNKYKRLNISDGPTFKIPNDPRYTKFGKFLSKSGIDELPQLINVLRSEMSFVGPRPLPLNEANKLSKTQKVRELVLPGITSSWVTSGSHNLKFRKWMKLDKEYVENASFRKDLKIIFTTLLIITTIGLNKVLKTFKSVFA